jgi:hypothetical protein
MAIDKEAQILVDQRNTPKATSTRNWYENTHTGPKDTFYQDTNSIHQAQAMDTEVEIDKQEAAANNTLGVHTTTTHLLHPIEKYTEGPKPEVYDGNPATSLTGIQ